MANLTEVSQWEEGIYQWELDDPVEGGPDGIDNVPTQQLANRTRYLFDNLNKVTEEISFGHLIEFQIEPTAMELVLWRALPLAGQIVQISQYQRLCDRKYVGDANNNTADWWYKCDHEGNRTTTGEYMRVLDHRGVASRAAGVNSKYKMANDTPYDGGSIGTHLPDQMQKHYHGASGQGTVIAFNPGTGQGINTGYGLTGEPADSTGNTSAVRTGLNETRSASISSYLCIKF
jgi:hypothetical protein